MKPFDGSDPTWEQRVELGRLVLTSIMRQGSKVDKFSTWMLGGAGAIAAILIANLDKLQSVFKPEWRCGLAFRLASLRSPGFYKSFGQFRSK